MKLRNSVLFVTSLLIGLSTSCLATHSGNRYFLFLERPENYVTKKKSFLTPAAFFTKTSTGFRREGGRAGLPELWGKYNLKDTITSLKTVYPNLPDPIQEITGTDYFQNKNLKYNIDGEVETVGAMLEYEQNLGFMKLKDFSVGFWFPVYHMSTTSKFQFNSNAFYNEYGRSLSTSEIATLDKIRQTVHKEMGIEGKDLNRGGFGDLDLHLSWNYYKERRILLRSIDTNVRVGVVIPTGPKMNINYPETMPFMNNGHWGMYLDIVPEFELKQDWKLGFMLGCLGQFDSTRTTRLAVGNEPTIYSALVGKIEDDPGMTYKISAYFTLENLTDGLHLQLRYTYLRHEMDKWRDKRDDQTTVKSYINQANASEAMSQNYTYKSNLSKWRAHFFTFELIYDSKDGLKNWFMQPKFYASYDLPITGRGISKEHQITLGAELHF